MKTLVFPDVTVLYCTKSHVFNVPLEQRVCLKKQRTRQDSKKKKNPILSKQYQNYRL